MRAFSNTHWEDVWSKHITSLEFLQSPQRKGKCFQMQKLANVAVDACNCSTWERDQEIKVSFNHMRPCLKNKTNPQKTKSKKKFKKVSKV